MNAQLVPALCSPGCPVPAAYTYGTVLTIERLCDEVLLHIFQFCSINSKEARDVPTRLPLGYAGPFDIAGSEVDSVHEWSKLRADQGWNGGRDDVHVLPGYHRHPWGLKHVCCRWRDLVMGDPSLWMSLEMGRPRGYQLPQGKGLQMLHMQVTALETWQNANPSRTLPPLSCTLHIPSSVWIQFSEQSIDVKVALKEVLPLSEFYTELSISMDTEHFNRLLPPHRFSNLISLSIHVEGMHDTLDTSSDSGDDIDAWGQVRVNVHPDYSVFEDLPNLKTLWCDLTYITRFQLPLSLLTSYTGRPRWYHRPGWGMEELHLANISTTLHVLSHMPLLHVCRVYPTCDDQEKAHPHRLSPIRMPLLKELQCTMDMLPYIDADILERLEIEQLGYGPMPPTMLTDLVEFSRKNSTIRHLKIPHHGLNTRFMASVLQHMEKLEELEVSYQVKIDNFFDDHPEFSAIRITVSQDYCLPKATHSPTPQKTLPPAGWP